MALPTLSLWCGWKVAATTTSGVVWVEVEVVVLALTVWLHVGLKEEVMPLSMLELDEMDSREGMRVEVGPREEERQWDVLIGRSERGPREAERVVGSRSEVGSRDEERLVPIRSDGGPRDADRVVPNVSTAGT